jgi:DNA-binding NarL/FixJ family response regulator
MACRQTHARNAMNSPYSGFTMSSRIAPLPGPSIRLMVVDDHPIMREGLDRVLTALGGISIIAEACDGEAAVDAYKRHLPDVSLIDLQMPRRDGLDTIRAIRDFDREARLIVLSNFRGDARIATALALGARAYVHKNTPPPELAKTVRDVHQGCYVMPAALRQEIANFYAKDALTARELDVLRLASMGKANREIGTSLRISETTVKTHMSTILLKLEASDRAHAVRLAVQRGFIEF